MIVRLLLVMLLALSTGCVHRTVDQDYGLGTTPKPAAKSADAALRNIFQQQTQGAFNPLTDDQRLQTVRNRLKLDPQDLAARLELGAIYENYHLYDDAFEQYTEALRLAGSAQQPNPPLAGQAVLGLGRSAPASGRSKEAIPLVEAFIKQTPSAKAWNELGLLYDQLGDLKAGETALRQAVALDADSDRLRNNLGYNLLLQNKPEAAEREFRRALELNPKSVTTRNNLGVVLARSGDFQGALEQFESAADAAAAHNNLAVVLMEMGQYERSREELVKALAIRRYFGPALNNFKLVQERIRERADVQKAATVAQSKDGEEKR